MNELKSGNVYIIKAINFKNVKIGYWTGTLNSLKQRYTTYYGSGVEVFAYFTEFPRKIEKEFKKHFAKYNISYEIYDIDYIEEYKIFFEDQTKIMKEDVKKFDNIKYKTPTDINDHNCPRCGYETDLITNFRKHLERTKLCKPKIKNVLLDDLKIKYFTVKIVSHVCAECDACFYSQSSYYVHIKNCKKNDLIDELKSELKSLKMPVFNSKIITNNTQINGLGKEDITKILNDYECDNFMVTYMDKELDGLSNYLIQKHFSKKSPENHNIKKINKKDKFIDIYDGKEWKLKYINEALDEVFNNIEKDFQKFLNSDKNTNLLKRNILDKFMRKVGNPLNWDLSHNNYEFEEDMSDLKRKKQIYMYVCELIYRKSKEKL